MIWTFKHPKATFKHLGYIPQFLSEDDPRPAREQINEKYSHGGGWDPFPGFTMLSDGNLKYPGDPPTRLLAETKLRSETIRFYENSWVVVMQEDASWEACRMD